MKISVASSSITLRIVGASAQPWLNKVNKSMNFLC